MLRRVVSGLYHQGGISLEPGLRSVSTIGGSATSSSSGSTEEDGQTTGQPSTTGRGSAPNWDWAYVIGKKPGRKPAIKRPQRHQWHFCNPNYDPNKPLPNRILPPHAPPSASEVDDWRLFHARLGSSLQPKSRKDFVRYLALRDVDWRVAFQTGLALYVAEYKKGKRAEAEEARQRAWAQYREKVFAEVTANPEGGRGLK